MGVIKNLLGDLSKSIGEPLIRGVLKLSSGHGSDKEPLREPIKKNLSIGQPIINKVSLVPDCLDRIHYHKKEGRNTLTHPHTHTRDTQRPQTRVTFLSHRHRMLITRATVPFVCLAQY